MNERETQLIEGIINTADRRMHNRCIQLLFHGHDTAQRDERARYKKNDYVVALEGAVRTCFSGRHYQGMFSETYMVFESLFVTYLEHLNPEKLREIDDLKNWLFVAACRFCNGNRKRINELLCIDIDDSTSEYDDSLKAKDQDNNDDSKDNDDIEVPDDITEPEDTSGWAASVLESYINKINNGYYRDLIRAIKLEDVPVETMAEDYGKSVDDIYRDYSRAWDKLLQVSLTDIRTRGKSLFKKYETDMDDRQAALLNQFFFSGQDLSAIALSKGMKRDDLEKAIIKEYKVLLKTAKRESEIEEKEKRKDAREQRQAEKEQKKPAKW